MASLNLLHSINLAAANELSAMANTCRNADLRAGVAKVSKMACGYAGDQPDVLQGTRR